MQKFLNLVRVPDNFETGETHSLVFHQERRVIRCPYRDKSELLYQ